jgi:tetratricopeptide (TPR) repeat protein
MNRTCTLFLAAALLAVTPTVTYAAGSGDDDRSASEPSVRDNYRSAVREVEAKNFRKAISLLNKVIDEKPRHPDALNYLGFSHRKLGDYARGVSYYKKALSLESDHKGANEYLGQAYVELGNMVGAEKQLTSLKDICGTRCDEYKSLKEAIDAAKARNAKQG